MRRGKNFEWKDLTSNLKEISSSICYATPKEHLQNRLIQSKPKRQFKKKKLPFHLIKQLSSQQIGP